MGHYTEFHVRAKIKPVYFTAIKSLRVDTGWRAIADLIPNCHKWLEFPRHDMIPFGAYGGRLPELKRICANNIWQFSCSLKNYSDQIFHFRWLILGPISDDIEICRSLFEDDVIYKDYTMVDQYFEYDTVYLEGNSLVYSKVQLKVDLNTFKKGHIFKSATLDLSTGTLKFMDTVCVAMTLSGSWKIS